MEEIVFKPKYKGSFWAMFTVLILMFLLLLGLGVMLIMMSSEPYLSDAETVGTEGIILAISSVLLLLCALNGIITKFRIKDGFILVSSLFRIISRRPYQPFVYYENGYFIINGYMFKSGFMKNQCELDETFMRMSAEGQLYYQKGDLLRKLMTPRMAIAVVLGVAAGLILVLVLWPFFDSLGLWVVNFFVFLMLIVYFAATINKLPRANRDVWREISILFSGPNQFNGQPR